MRKWTRRDLVKTGAIATVSTLAAANAETAPQTHGAPSSQPSSNVSINTAKNDLRSRESVDLDWRFALGHASDPARDFGFGKLANFGTYSKSGASGGPTLIDFDDSQWQSIQVPHDWAVALPFVVEPILVDHGAKPIGRDFPQNSIGWYRRQLNIAHSDQGKRIVLEFDGIFRDATIFINGNWITQTTSGYIPFEVDITDFLDFTPHEFKDVDGNIIRRADEPLKNILTVRVDVSLNEGWFYEGAGIYRHVWLRKTNPIHLVKDGLFVQSTPEANKSATLNVTTEIKNPTDTRALCSLSSVVLEASTGKEVTRLHSASVNIAPGEIATIPMTGSLASAKLWSLEERNLYRIVTVLESSGKAIDQDETRFGIRHTAFDGQRGFLLNGKPVKIKGMCNHQDHAGVGVAVPDSIQRYRIELLRAMNCNSLRTTHNTPAAEILDACDELGVLVMDENRTFSSNPSNLADLTRMIRRDRNHPSVIIWSLCNEEPLQSTSRGVAIFSTMNREVERLDPTRPITAAMNGGWGIGFTDSLDVMGFNYTGAHNNSMKHLDEFRAKFPNKPAIGTETASTVSTRGIYQNDPQRGYVSAYDLNYPSWASTAEEWWSFYDARDWLAGGYCWTGFDYRGEPTPYSVPCVSSHFGVMDLCGFPKDNFHYYRVWWGGQPAIHLFPHWNWEGREGQEISVWCYANCESVELFLNGISLGSQTTKKNSHLEWKVKYTPGYIEARGSSGGKVTLTQRRDTAGPAALILLETSKQSLIPNSHDCAQLNVSIVDAKGILVPNANHMLTFTIDGPGKIIGVGNGDPSCHEPEKASQRSAFNGLAAAFIQSTSTNGSIRVQVSASKLPTVSITLPSAT